MLVCSFVCANRTRDRVCSKHAVFPAPSDWSGQTKMQTSDAMRREKAKLYPAVIVSEAKQSMYRHKERMDCFAALAMTRRDPSSPVGSFGYENSTRCRLAHKS